VNRFLVEAAPDRRWPLHPRPTDWEDLETWVRRIAEAYGVSYDAFLLNALGHKGPGARDLEHAPVEVLARLSTGMGVSAERLRDMTSQRVMRRMGQWTGAGSEPAQDQAALDCLSAIGSRRRRRMSASREF
jgi:TniQ